jgi:hypothetical protein
MKMKVVLSLLAASALAAGQDWKLPDVEPLVTEARMRGLGLGLGLALDFDQGGSPHDPDYQRGQSALDAGHFDEAAKAFNAVVLRFTGWPTRKITRAIPGKR